MEDDLRRLAGLAGDFFDFLSKNRFVHPMLILFYLFISMPFFIILTFVPLLYYSSLVSGTRRFVFYAMICVWLYILFDVARDFYYSKNPEKLRRLLAEREMRESEEIERMSLKFRIAIERRMEGRPLLGMSALFSRIPGNRKCVSFLAGASIALLLGLAFHFIGFLLLPSWVLKSEEIVRIPYIALTIFGFSISGGFGGLYGFLERESSKLSLFVRSFYASLIIGLLLAAFAFVSQTSIKEKNLALDVIVSWILFLCLGWFFHFMGGLLGKDIE